MKNYFERSVQFQVFLLASFPFLITHHLMPVPTFYPELLAILIGLGLIICSVWRYGLSFGLPLLSPLIWIGLIGLQILNGQTPSTHDVLGFSGYVLWAIFLATALRQLMNKMPNSGLTNIFAAGLLTGACLNALAAILQVSIEGVPGVFYPLNHGVCGNIAQRNLLYSYLTFGIISAIHLYGKGYLPKLALAALLILLTFAINLTGSRAVLIYTALLVASIGLARNLGMGRRHIIGIALAVTGILFFQVTHSWVMTLLPGLGESMVERFQTQGTIDPIRLNMLAVAGKMITENPLLGGGLGSFDQRMFWQPIESDDSQYSLTNSEHSHNIVAQLAGELGLLALIPLTVLLIALHRQTPADNTARWLGWMVPVILIIHALVEYPLWYAHFLGIFTFFVAYAVPVDRKLITPDLRLKVCVAFSSTVSVFCIFWVAYDYYRLENYLTSRAPAIQIERAFNEISANPFIGHFAQKLLAVNLSPTPNRLHEKLALCRRSFADYADEMVIKACLPIYHLAGQTEYANLLRKRMDHNGLRNPPTIPK